jgi:hypothetical protein
VKTYDKAYFFLEEFTDFILYDNTRHSFIVNIKKDFFKVVYYELKRNNFKLVHRSTVGDAETITLVFIKTN